MLGFCAAFMLAAPLVRWAWRTMLPMLPEGTLEPVVTVRRLAAFDNQLEDQFSHTDPFHGQEFGGHPPTEKEMEGALAVVAVAFGICIFSVIGQVIFVCFYKQRISDQRPQWPEEGSMQYKQMNNDFSVTPFSCFDDMQTCLHVSCCSMARLPDTVSATGFMAFWMVLLVIVSSWIVASIVGSLLEKITGSSMDLVADLIIVACMVYFRQQLRQKLSGGAKPAFEDKGKVVEDCVLWLCCACCAAIQEARQVDQATGLEVECCLKLKAASQPMGVVQGNGVVTGVPLVGSAVAVQN
mmetsp:Transcript_66356/g.154181  ORF Transcript_66356/g.154181 Transcript_66356/m.154181 type:complete len:296 (+) Transcript_66356:69-956(+)